ncbi:MAG: hypothetical protein SGJ19_20990 [Planctomycetia bacterium]|nr:hypothetical protein [Planctomycetia bacterium]
MAESTFADELTASPELFPFAFQQDSDAVAFLRLSRADYAKASFLDARMLAPSVMGDPIAWEQVQSAAAALPRRCHFIFHISHVGSTLLSRLLGDAPGLFSLREPKMLRTLADVRLQLGKPDCPWNAAEFNQRLATLLGLWSRTFEPSETSVIKATSFVSEMSELLLERVPTSRAILLIVSPVTFLAALLDGAMSDITGQAERRLNRLHQRLGYEHWRLANLSPGECVAMSWLCEVSSLHAAAARFPERVFWLDFDHFLTVPTGGLAASLRHLRIEADESTVRSLLAQPTMQQYAKNPETAFDVGTRKQLLQQSLEVHKDEIKKGLNWLFRTAKLPGVGRMIAEIQAAVERPFDDKN